jgi:hypothetical protein
MSLPPSFVRFCAGADGLEATRGGGRGSGKWVSYSVVRAYLGIDNDTVWSIIRDDIPGLLTRLAALREQYPS